MLTCTNCGKKTSNLIVTDGEPLDDLATEYWLCAECYADKENISPTVIGIKNE